MAKTLIVRGSDGLVSIHKKGANYSNPLSNLKNIYFSSMLEYLTVHSTITRTILVDEDVDDSSTMIFGTHSLGFKPLLLAYNNTENKTVHGSQVVSNGPNGFSSIAFSSDENHVYLRQLKLRYDYDRGWWWGDSNPVPNYTASYTVFVLKNTAIDW